MTDEEKIRRCDEIVAEIAGHYRTVHELRLERVRLVRELRTTHSIAVLARIMRVSRGRIQQLEKSDAVA